MDLFILPIQRQAFPFLFPQRRKETDERKIDTQGNEDVRIYGWQANFESPGRGTY